MIIPFAVKVIKKLAPQIGATVIIEPEYGFVGKITFKNGKATFFKLSNFNINGQSSAEISNDKNYASFFIKQFGYKVPEGQTFFSQTLNNNLDINRNIDDGYLFAKEIGFPLIVKPNNLCQGVLVTKVYNKQEYYNAAKAIFDKTSVLIVEKFYYGNDYRIVVLDDEIVAAYQRIPLSVIGDGKSTIFELLCQKLETLVQNERHLTIKVDDFRFAIKLQRQGLNMNSVIPKNMQRYLLDNANLSTGGESIDVTHKVHSDFQKLAVNVTKDMALRWCGVDIITSDITLPMEDYVIIEINAAPGLDHYASLGERQMKVVEEIYFKILKALEKD